MATTWDAVVVGAGPNGLAAAIELQRRGHGVLVLEAAEEVGGGTRSGEATLPGFVHDHCSAIHPFGVLSPFFRSLPLEEHGLRWLRFPVSVGHPFDDGPAALLVRSLDGTAAGLGSDGESWRRLFEPWIEGGPALFESVLGPPRLRPGGLVDLARLGWFGLRSAAGLARRFKGERARGLLAGCAAHAVLPLERRGTAAVGLLFGLSAHLEDWPCAAGGSRSIAAALAGLFRAEGGTIETGRSVAHLDELPPFRVALFDLSPAPFARLAGDALPAGYLRRLARYRMGPATFKLDWALDGPIPWRDEALARASTVHVGGSLAEIAASERDAWEGRMGPRPFLILCQQSAVDPSRAPAPHQTGYAYAHVPNGWDGDATGAIEAQVERFAPGFRDRILARHATTPAAFEATNPNYVGGAVTGGAADLGQLFTRPVARLDPHSTPDPRLFLCSAATPPGGGVHGMCGYRAALSAARRLAR